MKHIVLFLISLSSFSLLESAASTSSSAHPEVTCAFFHGLADTHKQAETWTFFNEPVAPDFPDATEWFWRVNFPWTSLGQDNEIATIKACIDTLEKEEPTKRILAGGISRGAAGLLNFIARHKPKNIAACVLESPFSSMSDVAQAIVERTYLRYVPCAKRLSPYLVGCIFWQYSHAGIHPIDVVNNIDPEIPLLIVSTKTDHLVSEKLTETLVRALKKHGHKKVHHLKLTKGRHGKLMLSEQAELYHNVVHAFRAHYQLPCDPQAAQDGKENFYSTC